MPNTPVHVLGARHAGFFSRQVLGAEVFRDQLFYAQRQFVEATLAATFGEGIIDATQEALTITESAETLGQRRLTIVGAAPTLTENGSLRYVGNGYAINQSFEGDNTVVVYDPIWFEQIPYQDDGSSEYSVYVGPVQFPVDVGLKDGSGYGYSSIVEATGISVNPDSIVDTGSGLKLIVKEGLYDLGVAPWNSGTPGNNTSYAYHARVYLDTEVDGVEVASPDPEVAIYRGFLVRDETDSSRWYVRITGAGDNALGQGDNPSLDPTHYKVTLLGPIIVLGTGLDTDPNWVLIGRKFSNAPSVNYEETTYISPIGAFYDLFGVEHHLVTGASNQPAGSHKAPVRSYGDAAGSKFIARQGTGESSNSSQYQVQNIVGQKVLDITQEGLERWSAGVSLLFRITAAELAVYQDANYTFSHTSASERVWQFINNGSGDAKVDVVGDAVAFTMALAGGPAGEIKVSAKAHASDVSTQAQIGVLNSSSTLLHGLTTAGWHWATGTQADISFGTTGGVLRIRSTAGSPTASMEVWGGYLRMGDGSGTKAYDLISTGVQFTSGSTATFTIDNSGAGAAYLAVKTRVSAPELNGTYVNASTEVTTPVIRRTGGGVILYIDGASGFATQTRFTNTGGGSTHNILVEGSATAGAFVYATPIAVFLQQGPNDVTGDKTSGTYWDSDAGEFDGLTLGVSGTVKSGSLPLNDDDVIQTTTEITIDVTAGGTGTFKIHRKAYGSTSEQDVAECTVDDSGGTGLQTFTLSTGGHGWPHTVNPDYRYYWSWTVDDSFTAQLRLVSVRIDVLRPQTT